MAGGPNAQRVMCLHCGNRAERTSEGLETDWYECTGCGRALGIDWSYDGPPPEPRWPPDPREVERVREMAAKRGLVLPPLKIEE